MTKDIILYQLERELNIPLEEIEAYSKVPLDYLELSVRSYNCLKRDGISTVGELLVMDDEELMSVRNLGRRSYDEVKQCLLNYIKRNWDCEEEFMEEEIEVPGKA